MVTSAVRPGAIVLGVTELQLMERDDEARVVR